MNQNCRGSWALGTACGKCPRCEATRPAIAALRPQEAVMQSELKPCDFCGSSDHLRVVTVGVMTSDMPDRPHRVVCSHIDHDDVQGPVAYGRAEAIAAWNTRASDAEITRLTEALRKIAAGQFDGIEVTHWSARECRDIARQALAGAKP